MRTMLATLLLVAVAACSRQVQVRTASQPATSEVSIHMTNNLNQPVNVYVTTGGTDLFIAQVAANTTQHLPVQGVAAGSTVTLKAVTADNSQTYRKDNVILNGMYAWQVP